MNATNEPLTETDMEVIKDITAQLTTVTEPVENETILPGELRTTTFVLQQIEKLVSIILQNNTTMCIHFCLMSQLRSEAYIHMYIEIL